MAMLSMNQQHFNANAVPATSYTEFLNTEEVQLPPLIDAFQNRLRHGPSEESSSSQTTIKASSVTSSNKNLVTLTEGGQHFKKYFNDINSYEAARLIYEQEKRLSRK